MLVKRLFFSHFFTFVMFLYSMYDFDTKYISHVRIIVQDRAVESNKNTNLCG